MIASVPVSLRVILASLLVPCLCYAGSHPVRIDEHSNCLECHADHATGDHVHPAVKQGCTSCHSVENQQDVTNVSVKPAKSVICMQCHQPETFAHVHFPYASGMCTRCHNPHASANPRLLRAKVNEICLECHLYTPDSVPSRYLPTIVLTVNNSMGHPYVRHPVSGSRDPLRGGEMSCISCHLAHGGTKLHYLRMGSEIPEDAVNQNTETNDMCRKCHLILWGLDGAVRPKNKKKGK
jgi:predicted CXXCH cytochrome family protein